MSGRGAITWMIAGLVMCHAQNPPVIRPSPELTIHFADGQTRKISSYRGRVVPLVFVLPNCQKCLDMRVFSGYQRDHGIRGLQVVYVVIGSMAEPNTANLLYTHSVNGAEFPGFPVSYSSRGEVMGYLGYGEQIVSVPQIVWIDRSGNIRFQTEPNDQEQTTDADWRFVLEPLLAEPAPQLAPVAGTTPATVSPARPVARSYIGILNDPKAAGQGYRIARVTPNTPASRAGLQVGDVIVAVNGYQVTDVDGFRTMMADLPPGTEVSFTVQRNSQSLDISVTLGEPRAAAPPALTSQPAGRPASGVINWLGTVEKGGVVDIESKLLPGIPIDVDIDTTEFTVLEAPSAANGWKHLVFRCLNRRYTAISIRWTARPQ